MVYAPCATPARKNKELPDQSGRSGKLDASVWYISLITVYIYMHMPKKCTVRVIIIYPFAKGFQFNLICTFSFTLFPFVFNYSISIICFNYSIWILTVHFLEVVNIFVLYALINWPSSKTLIPEMLFPTIWSYNSELQFDLKRCKLDHILVKTPYPWYFLPLRWMSEPISMPRSHWQSININLVDAEHYLQTRKPNNTLQPHVFRCHTYCQPHN
jgi:hypothetical protein